MKAVIYARYSSDNQREESIEGQLRENKVFAKKNGIEIIGTYIDRALSAKTDNRPEFQKMIKDSSKGLFDVVLVWKLDRFARNRYDSAFYKAALKKNNVKVMSATENISEGADGILLEAILEGFAEYYSVELAEKIKRGMTENALKLRSNGVRAPIGYYIDDEKHFQIDENNAPIIKDIFTLYNDGTKVSEIVELMKSRGIKNRGNFMNYNAIFRILTNRKYIGKYKFGDILVPNAFPAIIDEGLFNAVQDRMKRNKKAPAMHRSEDDYLLTTHLFCGKCGSMMTGEIGTSHTETKYRYYKCNQAKKKKCDKKTVRKEWLENLVIDTILELITDDSVIEELAERVYRFQDLESAESILLKTQLEEVEKKLNNLAEAMAQGIFSATTKRLLDDLEAQKKTIETDIIQYQIRNPIVPKEQLLFALYNYRKLDMSVQSDRQKLIDSFVNSIYLYDDHFIITFNYRNTSKKVSLKEINSSSLTSSIPPKQKHPLVGCFCFGIYEWRESNGSVVNDCRGQSEPTLTEPAGETDSPCLVGCFFIINALYGIAVAGQEQFLTFSIQRLAFSKKICYNNANKNKYFHLQEPPMVNVNDFTGKNDSEIINSAIRGRGSDGVVVITRREGSGRDYWLLDDAITLPENTTVVLQNVTLKLSDSSRDNFFRTANCGLGIEDPLPISNVHIRGEGYCLLEGADHPRATGDGGKMLHAPCPHYASDVCRIADWIPEERRTPETIAFRDIHDHSYGTDAGVEGESQYGDWRDIGVLFANVTDFSISGIKIKDSHGWAISLEACSYGRVEHIVFDAHMHKIIDGMASNLENQDGIDLRNGCHHIVISDISGCTGDDVIALTAIASPNYKPGGSLRTTHVMHNDWSRRERDIHDIIIRNVVAQSYLCCLVRLLPTMSKIYNVIIDGIIGTSGEVQGYTAILLGEGGYGDMLSDCMKNVTVSNVICNSILAVDINGGLTDSVITNVINKNPSCPAVNVGNPENLKNVVITDTVITAKA